MILKYPTCINQNQFHAAIFFSSLGEAKIRGKAHDET
jgi:hypothetical protein